MNNLTNKQVRELRKQFRESKNHKEVKPVSLVGDSSDTTILFNVAGMQQLVPYLVGKDHPNGTRLYNIQKCLRNNDIDDIGDERHLSMFEMMWNRSLWDYFKKESLERTIEFLTSPEYLGIDINKLGGTIFAGGGIVPRDDFAFETLQKLGIKHITEIGFDDKQESDNFWTPGAVGPCGPCCEFYYDRGDDWYIYIDPISGQDMPSDRKLGVNDRYTEIRNNVFMEYYGDNGTLTPLSQQNVDTGMWFERLCMVLQGKDTAFDTDIFTPYIYILEEYSRRWSSYLNNPKSYRIAIDHLRAAAFLISDGILPSNEWRGYVVRRLIRRMYYNILSKIIFDKSKVYILLKTLIKKIYTDYSLYYDNFEKSEYIYNIIKKECEWFQKTIKNWIWHFNNLIKNNNNQISGQDSFKLYDTYWLPFDIVKDLCEDRLPVIYVSKAEFEIEMEKAKELSRKWANFAKWTDWSIYIGWLPETIFLWYKELELSDSKLLKHFILQENGQRVFIFDKTVFYAESGGQKGDSWYITLDDNSIIYVCDTIKFAGVYMHISW